MHGQDPARTTERFVNFKLHAETRVIVLRVLANDRTFSGQPPFAADAFALDGVVIFEPVLAEAASQIPVARARVVLLAKIDTNLRFALFLLRHEYSLKLRLRGSGRSVSPDRT